MRKTAEVEAGKIARQDDRVNAPQSKAERKSGAADAPWKSTKRALSGPPAGGEPIKIGHHSEGRQRAAIACVEADRYDPEAGYQPGSDEIKAARAKLAAPPRRAPRRVRILGRCANPADRTRHRDRIHCASRSRRAAW